MKVEEADKTEARPSHQEDAALVSLTDISILPTYPAIGNPKEAGIAIGIPETSVRELCRTGQLRAFKCGKLWKIPKAWLLEFIENGGTPPRAEAVRGGDAL